MYVTIVKTKRKDIDHFFVTIITVQQQRDHYRHATKRSPPTTPTLSTTVTNRNSQSPISSMYSDTSSSSLSQQSVTLFPKNNNNVDNNNSIKMTRQHHQHPSQRKQQQLQQKHQNVERSTVKNLVVSNAAKVLWAPPPAMYWSRPAVHGAIPRPVRAHSSVVVEDLMYVIGGTDSHGCLETLWVLELGRKSTIKYKGMH